MWNRGMIEENGNRYYYEVKHYEEGSEYGIKGGRISKLQIKNARTMKTLVNYDRGWDVEPNTKDTKKVMDELMNKFN